MCGDLLSEMKLQRSDIEFVRCEYQSGDGADGLKATYRVAGKDILNVENWLIRSAGVMRLRFACCGWETSDGVIKDRKGSTYYIGMGGEAYFDGHMYDTRKELTRMPYINLYVTHYFY
ncbi:DUF4952 domain-containing protein [Caballeronia sp. LZ019]|nr:DUF4952 domain-containing protein [Caballeronia sp. LZ019]MDR5810526.1 DUF4952 domain-containing protein [Caballeronia sp. LZ019]